MHLAVRLKPRVADVNRSERAVAELGAHPRPHAAHELCVAGKGGVGGGVESVVGLIVGLDVGVPVGETVGLGVGLRVGLGVGLGCVPMQQPSSPTTAATFVRSALEASPPEVG